jgi:hypothetical protein
MFPWEINKVVFHDLLKARIKEELAFTGSHVFDGHFIFVLYRNIVGVVAIINEINHIECCVDVCKVTSISGVGLFVLQL